MAQLDHRERKAVGLWVMVGEERKAGKGGAREGGQQKDDKESWLPLSSYRKGGQRRVVTWVQSAGRARIQSPGIQCRAHCAERRELRSALLSEGWKTILTKRGFSIPSPAPSGPCDFLKATRVVEFGLPGLRGEFSILRKTVIIECAKVRVGSWLSNSWRLQTEEAFSLPLGYPDSNSGWRWTGGTV